MHPIQQAILDLAERKNLADLSLRDIGREATGKEQSAQKIKYHMIQLFEAGRLLLDKKRGVVTRAMRGEARTSIVSLPIVGNASAGAATQLSESNVTGYIQVSRTITGSSPSAHFVVRAVGNSMNRAKVGPDGISIKDGDLIVVDSRDRSPRNGDYVLSVIDGYTNVKRFHQDRATGQVTLFSESSENHPPIFIHPNDSIQYYVMGKVKYVLKKPKVHWSKF